ncbi:MAG: recombinase, partial [Chitinophagaceae bacterium]|nr:recombinase [Rubrivivax sp.]
SLPAGDEPDAADLESFVDRVTQLIRSQVAGIAGNLALCAPLVLAVQTLCTLAFGVPLVGVSEAENVLRNITLLGPTALFAAFTGVLLFASSLVAGWAENWFVFHRLDSAIAWNPRIVATLGAGRAQRWAGWWRLNISGLAANVSLGVMLGMVPALAAFLSLGLDVRHVTLASGQLGAAVGALGWQVVFSAAFWWCVAGIFVIGVLNLTVSFGLAFMVALRSRGVRLKERGRIAAALRRRLLTEPLSFIVPPR